MTVTFLTNNDRTEIEQMISEIDGSTVIIDQTYNPESINPQSGVAVAEAINAALSSIIDGNEVAY